MRSLWKGAISFGLVHIPCRLYPATRDHDVHFRQLHGLCHTPIRYQKFCPHCEREVPADQVVRGFEVSPNEFVFVDDADLRGLPLPTAHTITIVDVVDLRAVDPLYFERGYYLGPAEGGGRPYALLREVLARTERAAVAQVSLRAKESLCLVRTRGECLVLETMYYPDEIRDGGEVDGLPGAVELSERETTIAIELVERLSGPWHPATYRDTYGDALRELIARKAVGEVRRPAEAEASTPGRYADLLSLLEESIRRLDGPEVAAGSRSGNGQVSGQ